VIQFALLFGLGFLSAALAVMLIAPAVHNRIVRYTENRIKATLPISPQEVRAQRDMARAIYAAENARTKQELVQEKDKAVALQIKSDSLAEEAKQLLSEITDLRAQIDNMDVEAADARARLRQEDSYIQQLKAALEAAEETVAAKDLEIDKLQQRQLLMTADADNFRIDLSTRDTEVENLKFRVTALRDERDTLRNDVRLQTARAKDAETRLAQEENRVQRLEDKLAKEIADRADRETTLERRLAEIGRLRDKLKGANTEARDASRALRDSAPIRPAVKAAPKKKITPEDINLREIPHAPPPRQARISGQPDVDPVVAKMADDARNRAAALSERLQKGGGSDEAIRQELASIAASMVAMTAASEGPSSPIHKILSGKSGNGNRESLATKSKKALATARDANT
jgi:predicted  nucleic acid-binding Zn-ribbon protein